MRRVPLKKKPACASRAAVKRPASAQVRAPVQGRSAQGVTTEVKRKPASAGSSSTEILGPEELQKEELACSIGCSQSRHDLVESDSRQGRQGHSAHDSTQDAALANALQAQAWEDNAVTFTNASKESASRPFQECRRRVTGKGGARALRLKDLKPRSPVEPPAPDEVESAEARLCWALSDYGLRARDITGDGACQFRAVADQLFGDQALHWKVRARAVDQLRAHEAEYRDFAVTENFEEYLRRMARPTTWGDNLSLQAVADAYSVQVCILSSFMEKRFLCIRPASGQQPILEVWLGFFAECHYTSLEPVDS